MGIMAVGRGGADRKGREWRICIADIAFLNTFIKYMRLKFQT